MVIFKSLEGNKSAITLFQKNLFCCYAFLCRFSLMNQSARHPNKIKKQLLFFTISLKKFLKVLV